MQWGAVQAPAHCMKMRVMINHTSCKSKVLIGSGLVLYRKLHLKNVLLWGPCSGINVISQSVKMVADCLSFCFGLATPVETVGDFNICPGTPLSPSELPPALEILTFESKPTKMSDSYRVRYVGVYSSPWCSIVFSKYHQEINHLQNTSIMCNARLAHN